MLKLKVLWKISGSNVSSKIHLFCWIVFLNLSNLLNCLPDMSVWTMLAACNIEMMMSVQMLNLFYYSFSDAFNSFKRYFQDISSRLNKYKYYSLAAKQVNVNNCSNRLSGNTADWLSTSQIHQTSKGPEQVLFIIQEKTNCGAGTQSNPFVTDGV